MGFIGTQGEIISDETITLKDGTAARKGVLEYRIGGFIKVKVLSLYTLKDEKWISVIVGVIKACYDQKYQDIIDSFEFI